jgi:hypothetical protein
MKEQTKQRLLQFKGMSNNGIVKEAIDNFLKDADAAVALAGKCEYHPMLHSLMSMEGARVTYLNTLGLPDLLYQPGKSEEGYIIDSAFDETIDDIVDAINVCKVK